MIMRRSAPLDGSQKQSLGARIIDRLIGFPKITVRYRAHWRIMLEANPIIGVLIEDSPRGERARHITALWLVEQDV
jgi:hypothetical protein